MKPYSWNLVVPSRYDTRSYRPDGTLISSAFGVVYDPGDTLAAESLSVSSIGTPGYRKMKRYQLPEKPHQMVRVRRTTGPAEMEIYFTPIIPGSGNTDITRYYGSGSVYGMLALEDGYLGDDPTNLAISRLQEIVKQSSGSALVTLAEINKTAKMVADTATRLATAFRALRRGNLGTAATALGIVYTSRQQRAYRRGFQHEREHHGDLTQFAANQWLAMTYGWKPLLQDVRTQAENLSRVMTARSGVLREVKTSAKSERRYVTERVVDPNWFKLRKETVIYNTVRFTVRYRIPSGTTDIVTAFGLQNPALVAWEVIPFSFVADWFLPIGNYLENLTAYAGLSFHSGTKSSTRISQIREDPIRIGSGRRIVSDRYQTLGKLSGKGRTDTTSKGRVILSSFPYQSFPSWKDPRSIAHATSAIALIQSVFRGSARQATLK
jgi:hypothetical protein